MRPLILASAIAFFPFSLYAQSPAAQISDAQIQTRASALEVAGAFSNDGFKIRDGHWWNTVSPKEPKTIQVNLYAGNQYWFIVAASPEAKKLTVTVYDEAGKAMAIEPYHQANQAAAGFAPTVSGPYYIRISEPEGEPATFCLLYSYK